VNFWRLCSRISEREKGFVFVTLIAAAANDWTVHLYYKVGLSLKTWTKMPLQMGWTEKELKKGSKK